MNGKEILTELDKSVHHEYSNFENSVSYFRAIEYSIWKHLMQQDEIAKKSKDDIIKILEEMKPNAPPELENYQHDILVMTLKNFQIMIRQIC